MTLSDDEDENLAQFLESEVLSEVSESEVLLILHNHIRNEINNIMSFHFFYFFLCL